MQSEIDLLNMYCENYSNSSFLHL